MHLFNSIKLLGKNFIRSAVEDGGFNPVRGAQGMFFNQDGCSPNSQNSIGNSQNPVGLENSHLGPYNLKKGASAVKDAAEMRDYLDSIDKFYKNSNGTNGGGGQGGDGGNSGNDGNNSEDPGGKKWWHDFNANWVKKKGVDTFVGTLFSGAFGMGAWGVKAVTYDKMYPESTVPPVAPPSNPTSSTKVSEQMSTRTFGFEWGVGFVWRDRVSGAETTTYEYDNTSKASDNSINKKKNV